MALYFHTISVFIACTGIDLFLKGKSSNWIAEGSYSVISQTKGGFITGGEEFSSLPSCYLSGPVCLLTKLSRESRLNWHRKESATGNSIR